MRSELHPIRSAVAAFVQGGASKTSEPKQTPDWPRSSRITEIEGCTNSVVDEITSRRTAAAGFELSMADPLFAGSGASGT